MRIYFFVYFILFSLVSLSQGNYVPVYAHLLEGYPYPCYLLPEITVESEMTFKNKRSKEQWTKLKYNVKKVYPYAIIASARLREYENHLKNLPDDKSRKKYMEVAEEQLKKEFSEELKKLTVSQGKILIKLIDRETGNTSYELVKQLRGSFSAFMWQSLAIIFGSNLKSEYDPKGEDKLIEIAIRQVEAGSF